MPSLLHSRLDSALYAALAAANREVLLTSPFLTMPVARELKQIKSDSSAEWTLLTRLDTRAIAAGALSTNGLNDLLGAGVRIRDLPALHAKVFLADDDFGIVGSANLTAPGLGSATRSNVELSVQVDQESLPVLHQMVRAWADLASPLIASDLRRAEELARRLPDRPDPSVEEPQLTDPATELLPPIPVDVGLWAKAQYGEPDWAQWRGSHWFSSRGDRRPGFKPGDLVLVYAQEARACYAVVEVIDEPTFDPAFVNGERDGGERWPWVNRTRPFLVPIDGRTVSPLELGFDGRGLQTGNKRLDLSQFLAALHALTRR